MGKGERFDEFRRFEEMWLDRPSTCIGDKSARQGEAKGTARTATLGPHVLRRGRRGLNIPSYRCGEGEGKEEEWQGE